MIILIIIFYGVEIVFPIAKSTENGAEMKKNRLRRLFAAVHNLLSNHAIYYTTQSLILLLELYIRVGFVGSYTISRIQTVVSK